ncbi:hypothetical protein SAMN05428939_7826 [Streptomyces sp. TLI_105]|nr:hypothetical protein SAMN05428939_7826 [Streptomyces sp. TLI_105]
MKITIYGWSTNELVHGWRWDVERCSSARWSLWLAGPEGGGLRV